jgi:two-component system capsular synthesis sensor histidine kinase RcsC
MTHQKNTKVLVVDDHEQSRNLFCEVLASAGYAVRAASDGMNALRRMEETRFDIVLTDFAMPHMDGLELLTEIRDRWPESRVVVHSNLLTWRVARLAKVEGAYACLSKSPNTAQLLETIASASSTA